MGTADSSVRDRLAAVLEAIDLLYSVTVSDERVRHWALADRAMHADIYLRGVLQRPGVYEVAPYAAYLRTLRRSGHP